MNRREFLETVAAAAAVPALASQDAAHDWGTPRKRLEMRIPGRPWPQRFRIASAAHGNRKDGPVEPRAPQRFAPDSGGGSIRTAEPPWDGFS
jgi:hypothetical protein